MNVVHLLLPDFALILCGYLVCRFTPLNRSVWQPVENLVYYFLFPVLLFHSIVKSPLELEQTASLLLAGVGLGLGGIALAYSLPYWPWLGKHIDPRLHAASAQVGFRFNSFIALALASQLAGAPGLLMVAMLIGVCVPLFNVAAVWPMARHAKKSVRRELLRNPLIIGTVCGLSANLLGFSLPAWIEPTFSRIGQAALALGLLAAGAGLQFGSLATAKLLGVGVLTVKHLALPLLALGLALLLQLDATQTTVLLMFSALPTASSCYVLAARMGYDAAHVAGLVTLSTLLGMVSLPFAVGLLARWAGG
ncbi:AEC family transporter [Hydrogenophaga sp.]|uniref:AEC family transporter n=1 Tax=Hydrogenophaga sp. TaxID=1904254 RepID=UPI0019C2288D|nr:AEC family transporter [Hydrogenophaga sp.]MBD3893320.1 AEC family transporter [Hydrogenophaga sp.]